MDLRKADDDKRKFDNETSSNWSFVYYLGVLSAQYPVLSNNNNNNNNNK
jgi:hypothetical protein